MIDPAAASAHASRRCPEVAVLQELFPFYFSVALSGEIAQVGERWGSIAPEVKVGARFDEVFEVDRPSGLLGVPRFASHADEIFLLRLRSRPNFWLRGQFIPGERVSDSSDLLFAGGPWLTKLKDLHTLGLELRDFPPHDPRGDLLIVLQTQESTLADLSSLTARLREELKHQKALEGQLRQIQKMELVGRFAGGMAHNFNNILMAIHGYAALSLMRLTPGDPLREWVEQIKSAADHAASLTRALLTLSRQHPMKLMPLDLAKELREIQQLVMPLLGERVRFSMDLPPSVGSVIADVSALKQMMMNLIINARDAMPQGGSVTVGVATRVRKESGTDLERHLVEVSVTDTGVGMDAKTKSQLFEPFFTTKEVGKGLGLGLSTVYGLMQQCGGSIEVESEVGKGTTFRLLFQRSSEAASGSSAAARPAPAGGGRVLLVEDEPLVRNLLQQLMGRAGYEVAVAAEPAAALDLIKRGEKFDVMVTDVQMPGMTGPQLSAQIEATLGPMPTLFVSGHTDDPVLAQGAIAPHHRYLQKPFAPADMMAAIAEIARKPAH
jgi:two-component system, cell cycle sensor histidine kinase and response regulator CckA